MPFQIVRNDLTKMKVDAIVNTANPMPVIGGGVDSAVYAAAGEQVLLAERKKIGEIGRGQAAITPAFNLDARYIIHTVGPEWRGGMQGEGILLRSCYENSLRLAQEHFCESIAFPLISTGTYGFPKLQALDIVHATVRDFLSRSEEDMMIYLVVFDAQATELTETRFPDLDAYIDDHYAKVTLAAEYESRLNERRRLGSAAQLPTFSDDAVGSAQLPDDDAGCSMPVPADAQRPAPGCELLPTEAKVAKAKRPLYAKVSKKETLDDLLNASGETFQQMLFRLIRQSGMSNPEVYKKANLDKKLFSKIKADEHYKPKKNTAVALALALELNLDQTRDLLMRAGYALSPSDRFDIIICYFIENGIYDIYQIEDELFERNMPTLCNYA